VRAGSAGDRQVQRIAGNKSTNSILNVCVMFGDRLVDKRR